MSDGFGKLVGGALALLGGLMLLFWSVGEIIHSSSMDYILLSFVASISVMACGILFLLRPSQRTRCGLISIASSLFLFIAERFGNILYDLQTTKAAGVGNPFSVIFQTGVLLSIIGGIIILTHEEEKKG